MSVKQHFVHRLRAHGKRSLSGLKASNRYSEGYLASLETTLAMAALYAEEQGWPDVLEISTEHIEDYFGYLQDRIRWFGERTYAEPRKLSKGHINAQYRRLNRFFNWLVERKHIDENPLDDIEPPSLEEKTVPIITEDQLRDLLTLADPALARTPAHRFRLTRDRAVLYAFWDTPGRLSEIAKLRLENTDLANGTLLVMGKGRKERKMPIGDTTRSVIWDYLKLHRCWWRTLGLPVVGDGEAVLDNGSEESFDEYDATVLWNGQPRLVETGAVGVDSLVGMSLMDEHSLFAEITDGGRVVIQPAEETWSHA